MANINKICQPNFFPRKENRADLEEFLVYNPKPAHMKFCFCVVVYVAEEGLHLSAFIVLFS